MKRIFWFIFCLLSALVCRGQTLPGSPPWVLYVQPVNLSSQPLPNRLCKIAAYGPGISGTNNPVVQDVGQWYTDASGYLYITNPVIPANYVVTVTAPPQQTQFQFTVLTNMTGNLQVTNTYQWNGQFWINWGLFVPSYPQSPWIAPINGNGQQLTNVGNIQATGVITAPIVTGGAGSSFTTLLVNNLSASTNVVVGGAITAATAAFNNETVATNLVVSNSVTASAFYGNGVGITNQQPGWYAGLDGGNWVNLNGVQTNFPNSLTQGIQEVWNLYTNSLPGNYGPTINAINFQLPGFELNIATNIVLSNQYPVGITFTGTHQLASKLVFTGTNVGVTWLQITAQITNASGSGAYPVHVAMSKVGFTATNYTATNILVGINNPSWIDLDSVDFRGWGIMTNQLNGVSLSQNGASGGIPGLGGLVIVASGEHLTSLRYCSWAGLSWGSDITCDHLLVVEAKPTFIGYSGGASPVFTGNPWPAYSPYWYSPFFIKRGGIDTTFWAAHNYNTGCFLFYCLGASGPGTIRFHDYVDETGSYYASFITDGSVYPTVENIVSPGISVNSALVTSNSGNVFTSLSKFAITTGQFDNNNNFGVKQPGGTFAVATNGAISGNGVNLTNLSVGYLTYSNAVGGTVVPYFTVSNTSTIISNGLYVLNSVGITNVGNGFIVTSTGNPSLAGTYTLNSGNIFGTPSGATLTGYADFTNGSAANIHLTFNESGYTNPSAWVFQNGIGGTNIICSAVGSGNPPKRADPVRATSWTDVGTNSSVPTVTYNVTLTTNYYNELAVAGTLLETNILTNNWQAASGVISISNNFTTSSNLTVSNSFTTSNSTVLNSETISTNLTVSNNVTASSFYTSPTGTNQYNGNGGGLTNITYLTPYGGLFPQAALGSGMNLISVNAASSSFTVGTVLANAYKVEILITENCTLSNLSMIVTNSSSLALGTGTNISAYVVTNSLGASGVASALHVTATGGAAVGYIVSDTTDAVNIVASPAAPILCCMMLSNSAASSTVTEQIAWGLEKFKSSP